MCDDVARMLCRRSVVAACRAARFDAVSRSAAETLEDVAAAYIATLARAARAAADAAGRSDGPTANDVSVAFRALAVDVDELTLWLVTANGDIPAPIDGGPFATTSTTTADGGSDPAPHPGWAPVFPRAPAPALLDAGGDSDAVPPPPPGQAHDLGRVPTLAEIDAELAVYRRDMARVRAAVDAARAAREARAAAVRAAEAAAAAAEAQQQRKRITVKAAAAAAKAAAEAAARAAAENDPDWAVRLPGIDTGELALSNPAAAALAMPVAGDGADGSVGPVSLLASSTVAVSATTATAAARGAGGEDGGGGLALVVPAMVQGAAARPGASHTTDALQRALASARRVRSRRDLQEGHGRLPSLLDEEPAARRVRVGPPADPPPAAPGQAAATPGPRTLRITIAPPT
jgi:histone H3/H4